MPVGDLTGPLGIFAYPSDDGNTYNIRMDTSFAAASGLSTADRGANPAYPRGCKVRHIWVQKPTTKERKKIPCTILLGAPTLGASVTVDTVAFQVTGYIGERFTPRV